MARLLRNRSWLLALAIPAMFVGGMIWFRHARLEQERLNEHLFDAVRKDDVGAVNRLLDQGADVNSRDYRGVGYPATFRGFLDRLFDREAGMTPLMIAAVSPNSSMVQLLLHRGARVNEKGPLGFTAVGWAHVASGSDWVPEEANKVIQILKQAGAKK